MKPYKRDHPSYALCGLNCCLCPRFHTDGSSKCPGCGGKNFHLLHPSCAVITCSAKHGNIQYCFECADFPCAKYKAKNDKDSFITYRNVQKDFADAKKDLKGHLKTLDKKLEHLLFLLEKFDDGRSKSFFCTAVNLLPLPELDKIMKSALVTNNKGDKTKAKEIAAAMKEAGEKLGIEVLLRK